MKRPRRRPVRLRSSGNFFVRPDTCIGQGGVLDLDGEGCDVARDLVVPNLWQVTRLARQSKRGVAKDRC